MKLLLFFMLMTQSYLFAQNIPARWDELTATDWPIALERSSYTCILPIGILEKHGMHLPFGTDLINAREWSARASQKEYAVLFPDYFFGQNFRNRHQPGNISLPSKMLLDILDATCEEIGRNGFKKIVIVNGHGGNVMMLNYFVLTQLEKRRSYAVYLFGGGNNDAEFREKVAALKKSDPAINNGHAGEEETSGMLYMKPELVKLNQAEKESGLSTKQLEIPPGLFTPITWFANFPNQYAGEGHKSTVEYGKLITEQQVAALINALKFIKSDTKTLEFQNQFFDKVYK